jgi:DNA-binding NarL/FixJ family response regulator
LDALAAGARGYVLKTRDAGHITRAIRLVADGDLVIDPEVARLVVQRVPDHGGVASGPDRLSGREKQVLSLLSDGRTNKQIASALRLSPETIKACLSRIFFKLGARDRAAAVAEALRLHAID